MIATNQITLNKEKTLSKNIDMTLFEFYDMLNKGFTIEICFKSDAHVNPNGTIFSFGQFNKDGEFVLRHYDYQGKHIFCSGICRTDAAYLSAG